MQGDQEVTITAKVEHKGQTFTKDFKFAVLADSPKTRLKRDQIAVNNDFQPLMNENDMNLVNAVDFINQTKIEEDPNAKKEPTEIKVEEKRSKQGRIALLCSIAITGVAALIALYLSVRHIIDLFF